MRSSANRRLRVAIAELSQESNSFTGIPTTLADFQGRGGDYRTGDAAFEAHRGVNTVLGGFIEGLESAGHEIKTTLAARACPGGPLSIDCYTTLRDELLTLLADARPDAILLSLHGSMVADGEPDPEADILGRVRTLFPDLPVVVVLDMHANLSAQAVRNATAIIGYRTYPHVDMAESGRRAAALLATADLTRVFASYRRLPLLLPSINMRTDDAETGPMAGLQRLVRNSVHNQDDLLEASLFAGFPYADVPCSHASVVTYSSRDQQHADSVADEIAQQLWDARHAFERATTPAEEAVAEALNSSDLPLVLADVADNPGSGGTGETTTLLRLLLEQDADAFVGILHDPEAVDKAFATPIGETAKFLIGGKIAPRFGAPVSVEAVVERHSEGEYVHAGPMLHGKRDSIGRTALLRVGNVKIGITEGRSSVNDPNMLTMLGLEPSAPRILALKVKGHFRAGFAPLVARIVDTEAPGASMTDFTQFPYQALDRPLHPFDPIQDWRSER